MKQKILIKSAWDIKMLASGKHFRGQDCNF